ncbi:MAG: glycosyltransferase family 4 protein [Agromyces sp.]|nr:glycosyltransferase family 4 protein [Agromyces sp.]
MTEPLRILHTIRSDGFAGVEQFVLRLARAQAADGHRVAVIGGATARMRPSLDAAGIEHTPAARTLEVARAVRRQAGDVDVVNTHMTAAEVGTVAGLAGRGGRQPAVVATRHFAKPRGRVGPVPVGALVGRRIDAQLAISEVVAASVDGPSTVVHPGVEERPLGDGRPRARTVLMAQRLEPEKHTQVGIRAFAASGLAADDWTLEIAGTGSELAMLRALVAELGLERAVRFLGFRGDLPDVAARAGILLASCPFEHFGLSVLEAMAGGLPVVAAAGGGHREMLEGLDPRAMFRPDDVTDAAAALRSLADDAAGRDALGAAEQARQRQEFSLRAQVEGTDAVYRRVL